MCKTKNCMKMILYRVFLLTYLINVIFFYQSLQNYISLGVTGNGSRVNVTKITFIHFQDNFGKRTYYQPRSTKSVPRVHFLRIKNITFWYLNIPKSEPGYTFQKKKNIDMKKKWTHSSIFNEINQSSLNIYKKKWWLLHIAEV